MFGFDFKTLAAIALIVVGAGGFLWTNRGAASALLARLRSKSAGVTDAKQAGVDEDMLDLQAWNRLRKRKSLQTSESQAALKVIAANFLETTP